MATENKIKFSHDYCKVHNQTSARLMDVSMIDAEELNADLIEYDTKYIPKSLSDSCSCELHTDFDGDIEHCHYPLPRTGELVILTFIGNKHIPFCTIRTAKGRYGNKYDYYAKKLGRWFDIVIESEVQDGK